jgi:signal peptide peptidase SppA
LLDIDSPGGEVDGCFETTAAIRAASAAKPVIAVVNGMAASAAYSMVSGATRIFTTPSGMSGSIGVVLLHLDRSAKMEKQGIRPTLIFAGAHKVDGHPFGPLPDSVAEDLKAEVNQFYEQFVATVAAGRKSMTEQSIRATEARTYIGADAVKVGIADAVSTFEDVLTEITRASGRSTPVGKGVTMTDTKSAPAAEPAGITEADHAKAVADAQATGAKAAQDRIAAIMVLDAAKDRPKQASHIAFKTAMSVDDAKAMLEASAPETSAKQVASIEDRANANGMGMGKVTGQPGQEPVAALWDEAVTKVNAQFGIGVRH